MAASTPATAALEAHGAAFTQHPYSMDVSTEVSYGEAVAAQLGVMPERLFKTLMTVVDGEPTCAIVPVSGKLSLRKLAKAAGGKKAEMAPPKNAQRWTGYQTGGISPFGQKRQIPTFVDETAELFDTVYTSGGKRGLQIEFSPNLLVTVLGAYFVDLVE